MRQPLFAVAAIAVTTMESVCGNDATHADDVYRPSTSEQGFNSLQKDIPACRINWSLDAARRERRT
jgi:hypothetical protein